MSPMIIGILVLYVGGLVTVASLSFLALRQPDQQPEEPIEPEPADDYTMEDKHREEIANSGDC